jgi:hypothetical protein
MARVDDYVDMASKAVRAATARADKWDGPKSGPTAATRSPLNRAEHKSTVARLPSSEWGFNRDILHARKHVQPRGRRISFGYHLADVDFNRVNGLANQLSTA